MTPAPRPPASEEQIRLERLRRQRRSYPLWRLIWANLRDDARLLRHAWFSLASLTLVFMAGAFYLLLVYFPQQCQPDAPCAPDLGLAAYETLKLLIFQSGLAFPADLLGRLLFFAIPLLGLFFLLQSAIDLGRLIFDKNINIQGWQISLAGTFRGHVVVCGIGRVGYRTVLQLLDSGYEVVAIEIDWQSEFVPTLLRLKVPVIHGDARDPDVQAQAGMDRACGLIAAINDDLRNIEIALCARRRHPEFPTVLRIYNRDLDLNLERRFGRNTAFSSSALAAPTFAAAAMSRAIVNVIDLPEGLLGISELTVAPESALCGFVQAVEQQQRVRVIRRRNAAGHDRPLAFLQRIEAGDRLLLLGTLEALEEARRDNRPGSKLDFLDALPRQRPSKEYNTVIVCGLGKVGTQVVDLLRRSRPRPQLVVICTPETPPRLTDRLQSEGIRIIRGDARDPAVLAEAGIARAYSVAALFGDDLLNLEIGMAARGLRADIHLVLRVFSDVLAERLATLFGINTAYSTSALAAPTLAAAAVRREIDYAFDIGERLMATRTLTVQAGDRLVGKSIRELHEHAGSLVILCRREGVSRLMPETDSFLEAGDEVVLLTEVKGRREKGKG